MNEASRHKDTFQPGDLLNNTYRIEGILGRGGTSEVYRARSEISGRVVALKALRLEFARNEDYLLLMTREEEIREIRHDGIVRYYDNQRTDDGHVFLVMDYVDGPGLDLKMKQGGMSAADLMVVAGRVCDALNAAHSKNIVHRDLSPDNIILKNGNPADAIIIDFGIAKDTNPGAATIVGNEFAGKYAYAAPEQLNGQSDARSDIYALGALLLATFRGKAPNVGANPIEVIETKNRPLDTDGVPEPLKSLIDRMTHPDREKRLQSANAVLDAIRNSDEVSFAQLSPVADTDDERTVIAPRPASAAKAQATPPPQEAAPKVPVSPTIPAAKKSSSRLIALLVVPVLVAAGAGAYFSGALDGILGPKYPVADPFTLVAKRTADGRVQMVGFVPSEAARADLSQHIGSVGGTVDLTLASGDIAESWGTDIASLLDIVTSLPEWQVLADGNQVRVTGMTLDRAEQTRMNSMLTTNMPAALNGSAEITLGPRILSAAAVTPLLVQYADCGDLTLIGAPATGYVDGARVIVSGRVAEPQTQVELSDAITAIAGNRDVVVETEVLNPALCLIDAALPSAPPGGFDISFGFGDRPDPNPTGRYLVGENPVIDVTIPADVNDGYLFVSALDVSGNVFHMLPNLNREDNSIATLRDGVSGPLSVRVAFSLAEAQAADGKKLAFVVDDTSLGKTRILVLHAAEPIFGGLRPTMESAGGYAQALQTTTARIETLDSKILTTAQP